VKPEVLNPDILLVVVCQCKPPYYVRSRTWTQKPGGVTPLETND